MDRSGRRQAAGAAGCPPIDLLIPSRNRHEELRERLPGWLQAARQLGGRVRICDQSLRPFAPVGEDSALVVAHRPDLTGLPAARNWLLRHSHSGIVCFCDDDLRLLPAFAEQLRAGITAYPDAVAWGPMIERRTPRQQRAYRLSQWGSCRDVRRLCFLPVAGPVPSLFGCCFAVRREAALATGFDAGRPGYALGEDHDFFLRLPGRKIILPGLACRHEHRVDPDADRRRSGAAKARWLLQLARRHGQRNPATLLHLALALAGVACGSGRDPGQLRGVLAGLTQWSRPPA